MDNGINEEQGEVNVGGFKISEPEHTPSKSD